VFVGHLQDLVSAHRADLFRVVFLDVGFDR
jgi:hypothetical protein